MSTNPNFGVWRPMAENVEFNALESNSNAVMAVADTVRTTLGPKGLDKLLIDQAMALQYCFHLKPFILWQE
jgi:archaeal chaperonin